MKRHEPRQRGLLNPLAAVAGAPADSAAEGLSADWRMNIAYNAALQAATVALAAAGCRASRDQHHYRVIQSLQETLGTDASTVHALDTSRKKRDAAVYDRAGLVSDSDAQARRDR